MCMWKSFIIITAILHKNTSARRTLKSTPALYFFLFNTRFQYIPTIGPNAEVKLVANSVSCRL